MKQLLASIRHLRQSIDHIFFRQPPFGGPALACDVMTSHSAAPSSAMTYGSVREMIDDLSIVFGVPKYRTSKPKKVTRKFSFTRLLQPVENLVGCPVCSSVHPADTVCQECYKKVHELTNEIKRKMMQYNPYVGDKQDKELFVKFKGDAPAAPEVVKGKRVVEMEKERPTWFKNLNVLQKK